MQFSISDYSFRLQTVPASARVAVFCGAKRILTVPDKRHRPMPVMQPSPPSCPVTCADWALPKTMPP